MLIAAIVSRNNNKNGYNVGNRTAKNDDFRNEQTMMMIIAVIVSRNNNKNGYNVGNCTATNDDSAKSI